MGLFSGIGHFFKGILNGVKSVFKFVGKVLSSKVGRIVMLAAGVFTAGVALAAGVGAFAASSGGFLSSVTQGGSAFVSALAHPVAAFSGEIGSGVEATGQALAAGAGSQTASVASTLASANAGDDAIEAAPAATDAGTALTAAQGGGAADSYSLDTGLSPTTGAAAPAAGGLTGPGVSTVGGSNTGLLSQAQAASSGGTSGWVNGTTTPGNGAQASGGNSLLGSGLIAAGNLASGMAQGAAQEKINEQQQQQAYYYGNLWNPAVSYNGNVGGAGVVNAASGTPSSPNAGYLQTAQNIAGFMNGKAGGSFGAPNVQPGAPTATKVASAPNVQGPSLPSA